MPPEPTASLTFGGLTFSGTDDGSALGLVSLAEPPMVARITYADDSPHVEGSLATQAVWAQTTLIAVVGIKGTDQANLETLRASVRSAVGQFRQSVVSEVNGYQRSWAADMGSLTSVDEPDDYTNLRDFEAFYTIAFPVRPTAEVI